MLSLADWDKVVGVGIDIGVGCVGIDIGVGGGGNLRLRWWLAALAGDCQLCTGMGLAPYGEAATLAH